MQIHHQSPDTWADLNDFANETLGLRYLGGASQLYTSLAQALMDVLQGLTHQFPNKKKVFFLRHIPSLEAPLALLSRDGYLATGFDFTVFDDPKALESSLDHQTLLVVLSEDDPMLGQRFHTTPLETMILNKKIFCVKVSHHHHRYLPLPPCQDRYHVFIHALSPHLALLITHSRLKWNSILGPLQTFFFETKNQILQYKKPGLINPKGILQWEDKSPADSRPFFSADQLRVYDRLVLYWTDMDGWAVATRLAARLNLEIPPPGFPTPIETTSLHRWFHLRAMDWLKAFGFSQEMIRGTIILDQDLLSFDLADHLQNIRQEILEIQQQIK